MTKQHYLIIIASCAALSGLLFGYDAGIISGALLFINQVFALTSSEQGWLVVMVPLGALLSSAMSGKISDIFGRKTTLLFTATAFIIGTLMSAFTPSLFFLMLGRAILGIAIGIGSTISPVYTSELADEKHRGFLVNLFVVFIQFGIFLSFVVGYLFSSTANWRLMIGLGIFPALLFGIAVFYLPESPRWLIMKSKIQHAFAILLQFYDKKEAVKKIRDIQNISENKSESIKSLLKQKKYLKVIFIGIAVSFFTQTVGINAFNYYAPTIFLEAGFSTPSTATYYTMFMGLMLVLSTISSLFFIDKIGRRKPLLFGTLGILLTLISITFAFSFITNLQILSWTFLICAILFMIFHGMSIGPACFLIPSEILPLQIRGFAMGISVAFNWGANVLVAAFVPYFIHYFSVATLFGTFFIITSFGWIIFYYFIPETKCITLEQIERDILTDVSLEFA